MDLIDTLRLYVPVLMGYMKKIINAKNVIILANYANMNLLSVKNVMELELVEQLIYLFVSVNKDILMMVKMIVNYVNILV